MSDDVKLSQGEIVKLNHDAPRIINDSDTVMVVEAGNDGTGILGDMFRVMHWDEDTELTVGRAFWVESRDLMVGTISVADDIRETLQHHNQKRKECRDIGAQKEANFHEGVMQASLNIIERYPEINDIYISVEDSRKRKGY